MTRPAHHKPDPYKVPAKPYAYAYGVADEYAGTSFDKKETQDNQGVVKVRQWFSNHVFVAGRGR